MIDTCVCNFDHSNKFDIESFLRNQIYVQRYNKVIRKKKKKKVEGDRNEIVFVFNNGITTIIYR